MLFSWKLPNPLHDEEFFGQKKKTNSKHFAKYEENSYNCRVAMRKMLSSLYNCTSFPMTRPVKVHIVIPQPNKTSPLILQYMPVNSVLPLLGIICNRSTLKCSKLYLNCSKLYLMYWFHDNCNHRNKKDNTKQSYKNKTRKEIYWQNIITDWVSSWCVNGLFGRYVWFWRLAHSQKRWNCTGMPNSFATSSY